MARILIVDGDPFSREALQRAVAREGLEAAAAGDPEAGWEAFQALAPRAVVLGRGLDRAGVERLIVRMRRSDPSIVFLAPSPPWEEMARGLRIRLGAPAPRASPPPPRPTPGTDRVLSRAPVESGTLDFGTLADLLTRLWRAGADGIVALEGPRGDDRIFLLRGAPVAVRLAGRDGAEVTEAIARLCASADGPFSFHPGSDFAPEVRGERQPALAPLLAGLRLAADEPSFAEALAGQAKAAPRRTGAFAAVVTELGLSPADGPIAAAIDGATPLAALLGHPGRPASLLWFLLRSGGAGLPAGARAAAGAREPAVRPAPGAGPASLAAPGPLDPG